MIRTETMADGRIRHYSDLGVKIRQVETGIVYEDAVDSFPYTYEETDELIPPDDSDVASKAEAYDILTGVSE